MDTLDSKC
jgi:hypothetical protein